MICLKNMYITSLKLKNKKNYLYKEKIKVHRVFYVPFTMERETGLKPATFALATRRSIN